LTEQDDKDKPKGPQFLAYVTIPFVLAVPPIVGWAIGSWLDKTFHTTPVLMFVMVFFGFVAGGREFYRIIKRFGSGF
jgi:ATP synthase protein I